MNDLASAELSDALTGAAKVLGTSDEKIPSGEIRHRPLSFGQKLTLSTGAVVDGVSNSALTAFHFFYLTVVCGLSGSLAGASVFIALTIDAFADPLIGSLSDNWVSRRGRRHPFMFASILPVAIALGLAFSIPPRLPTWELFAYVTVVAVVYRIGSSAFTLPFAALGAELSDDYVERSVLRIYNSIFTTGSSVLAVTLLGFGVFMRGPNGLLERAAYIPFGWTCALLVAASGLYCAFGTYSLRGRLHAVAKPAQSALPRLLREVGEVLRNRSFRIIILTALIWFIALGVVGTLGLHNNRFFWRLPNSIIQGLSLALFAGGALGILPAIAIASKVEKRSVVMVGLIVFIVLQLVMAPMRILGLLPPNGPLLYWILVGVTALIGVMGTCCGIFFWSMMADATDEHELLFGARREGLYFAGMTLSAKAAAGVGVLVGGIALDIIGFPHDVATLAKMHLSTTQIDGLGIITGPLAAVMTSISLFLLWGYRIDRKEHARIVAALDERRRAQTPKSDH
jgi:glycoside/pentoside/hexuronide:cation symporter, GPH family